MNVFISADKCKHSGHGGGSVCWNEVQALRELDGTEPLILDGLNNQPFVADDLLSTEITNSWDRKPGIAHFYSGTFSKCVKALKDKGWKVTYTCAAHRISDSKKAHEDLGTPYNLPHLTEPELWKRYSQGYWDSDVLIVPSHHSREVVYEQMGAWHPCRVEIIPHGTDVPKTTIPPLPKKFTVGYLGALGADKGVRYLLSAWKKLNYKDSLLIIGGKDSEGYLGQSLVSMFGGGSIYLAGWQENISEFYNKLSLYVQPSATEGFGLEVLEAHAHGRVALCSDHAGAVDLVHDSCKFPASNVDALAEKIDEAKTTWDILARSGKVKAESHQYEWYKIRKKYVKVWKGLLS